MKHACVCSWNQPVLSNDGKVACSTKQRESLIGFELTPDTLFIVWWIWHYSSCGILS